jgi:hypothetical protein
MAVALTDAKLLAYVLQWGTRFPKDIFLGRDRFPLDAIVPSARARRSGLDSARCSIGPMQTPQLCSSIVNRFSKDIFLSRDKHRMATRVIKLREAEEPAPVMVQEVLSQSKRPEVGRFLLQVDRQTKRSYATAEAAETAGMVIKKGHPIVRVSVYDSVETANKIIELPAGSSPKS